jgi:monoamine oxidase
MKSFSILLLTTYLINPSSAVGAPSVTIIGAGMSGASAANALVAKGYSVTIVEARDRIGGRTHTDRTSLSKPVDLGAGWIHEAVGNPITSLCKKYNI